MKKFIFGGIRLLAGSVSAAVLLTVIMLAGLAFNRIYLFGASIRQFIFSVPVVSVFVIAAIVFVLSVRGLRIDETSEFCRLDPTYPLCNNL